MSQAGNMIEVHLPEPRLGRLFWAVGIIGFFGLKLSLILWLIGLHKKPFIGASLVCFAFTIFITTLLSWQLGRYINAIRDSVKQAVKTEYSGKVIAAPPVNPPQPPLQAPAAQRPAASVTEHTTRSFGPSLEQSDRS